MDNDIISSILSGNQVNGYNEVVENTNNDSMLTVLDNVESKGQASKNKEFYIKYINTRYNELLKIVKQRMQEDIESLKKLTEEDIQTVKENKKKEYQGKNEKNVRLYSSNQIHDKFRDAHYSKVQNKENTKLDKTDIKLCLEKAIINKENKKIITLDEEKKIVFNIRDEDFKLIKEAQDNNIENMIPDKEDIEYFLDNIIIKPKVMHIGNKEYEILKIMQNDKDEKLFKNINDSDISKYITEELYNALKEVGIEDKNLNPNTVTTPADIMRIVQNFYNQKYVLYKKIGHEYLEMLSKVFELTKNDYIMNDNVCHVRYKYIQRVLNNNKYLVHAGKNSYIYKKEVYDEIIRMMANVKPIEVQQSAFSPSALMNVLKI